jgi:hypothetical protein
MQTPSKSGTSYLEQQPIPFFTRNLIFLCLVR